MLKLTGVAKSFGGLAAVHDCSYEVGANSITCLIGPNGAGKTTTFNLISGFDGCDAGEISFNGTRISGLAAHQIARLGLVRTFQTPRSLNSLSALESLKMAPPNDALERMWAPYVHFRRIVRRERELDAEAREVLDLVGLSQQAESPGRTLSGGQKKLLELARAIMFGAKLILLDEPTAGVNPVIIGNIVTLLRRLRDRKIAMFIVEHNMEFVREISDRVIVMAEGAPLTEGSFDEIRAHPLVADAYLGRQS